MNEITNITRGAPLTMSSIEIAALCEKRHDNVVRDIKVMFEALNLDLLKFEGIYSDAHGREQKCVYLPKRETMILVSGYKTEFRAKIIDRLDELERRPALDLSNPVMLRSLLLENVEKVLALENKVEEMRPAVDALEKIAEAHGSFCRTEAAKHLGIPPHTLIRWMKTNNWTYRRAGSKDDIAYQSKIVSGYLEHKVNTGPRPDGTEWISTQVRVTPKGLTILAKAFPKALEAA